MTWIRCKLALRHHPVVQAPAARRTRGAAGEAIGGRAPAAAHRMATDVRRLHAAQVRRARSPTSCSSTRFPSRPTAPCGRLQAFRELAQACASTRPTELFTYTYSTRVRAAMLAAGFYVAMGRATGPKARDHHRPVAHGAAAAAHRSRAAGARIGWPNGGAVAHRSPWAQALPMKDGERL